MVKTTELATDESEYEVPDRLTENDAVAQCVRAWRITMKNERAELEEGESEFEAEQAAKAAFLRAMPPLSGYQNICDFIACVANGSMVGVIRKIDADRLLEAAKIAICALRIEQKPHGAARRRPGRPRKTAATEENK